MWVVTYIPLKLNNTLTGSVWVDKTPHQAHPGIESLLLQRDHISSALLGYSSTCIVMFSTSALASSHAALFRFAQSTWHCANSIYNHQLGFSKSRQKMQSILTIYRRRSSSFSLWNRRKSFITPVVASFVSFSATPKACSSCAFR